MSHISSLFQRWIRGSCLRTIFRIDFLSSSLKLMLSYVMCNQFNFKCVEAPKILFLLSRKTILKIQGRIALWELKNNLLFLY